MCMYRSIIPVLGVIQIFVGLLNIGLGPGRTSMYPGDLTNMGAAYWLGAVYIITGIFTITLNCCPYFVSVIFAVTVNIISSIYAIIGIVLYALDLDNSAFIGFCQNSQPSEEYFNECELLAYITQRLVIDMDITLIVLAVLQLGVSIAITVLGIRALCGRWKEKGVNDTEIHQPILKEVLMMSPGAEKGFTLMFGSLK
ncbi:uncharacterized protein LOC106098694 [Oreochromis niloticus]|uniref:Uncharacterized protein n=1 Tax=Oreochromis aureus TaxID=47969 RepID=A0A668URU8_OREAU|nr:uncharacterized protein LOC106098694 [Oreochromis niloticus]CAI5661720.1 unnamed protein product [Mustela putorius furo]